MSFIPEQNADIAASQGRVRELLLTRRRLFEQAVKNKKALLILFQSSLFIWLGRELAQHSWLSLFPLFVLLLTAGAYLTERRLVKTNEEINRLIQRPEES